jgi:alcohol dehydrogenase
MDNFDFRNPTKIVFGRGTEARVGAETARYAKKVLLHSGGGSVKASGLLDRVATSLRVAGVEWVELGGVVPNPWLSLVREGVRLCKEKGVELVLAGGGGSVIDSAKAIAMGAVLDGDVWDFYLGKGVPQAALPVDTVLTIPAAGSEASTGTVITNEDGLLKRSVDSDLLNTGRVGDWASHDIEHELSDEMAAKRTDADQHTVGHFVKLDRAAVRGILELAR